MPSLRKRSRMVKSRSLRAPATERGLLTKPLALSTRPLLARSLNVTEGAGASRIAGCSAKACKSSSRTFIASVSSGRVRFTPTTPRALPMVTLRTVWEMNCEFGTITVERSPIWISVARTLIRRISPSTPPRLTQSPTSPAARSAGSGRK